MSINKIRFSTVALFCLAATIGAAVAQSSITNIPGLGGSVVQVTALNNNGVAVGFSRTTADTNQHAFVFTAGVTHDLGGDFSAATDINASGQITGYSTVSDTHAFLFSLGGNTDLGTLGGSSSTAAAINDNGQVVGRADLADSSQRAFLYSGGQMTNLGTLGGNYSAALALNNAGQVAGESSTSNNATHAFLYTGGTMIDLDTLGSSGSSPIAVNSLGQVAGSFLSGQDSHGFLFNNGVMTDIGTLGGTYSAVLGLNDSGQAIGESTTTNNSFVHAFLYSGGVLTDLGTLGGTYSSAAAINHSGSIVGTSQTNAAYHAFLWQSGTMIDLNSLLPANSGWDVLRSASFINDAGQIAGQGSFHGMDSWFLLTPPTVHQPPIANAGPDQTVECPNAVTLNGSASSSPDGSPLTYEWRENNTLLATGVIASVSLALGSHSIVLTVTDARGASDQATLNVNVVDRTPPTVACPEPLIVSAGTDGQATVPNILSAVTASDSCTPTASLLKTQSPAAGTVLGIGTYTITVTVTDASRNKNTCTTSLAVQPASDKITICHKGRIRITVSSRALDAHLAHGDTIGSCTGDGP